MSKAQPKILQKMLLRTVLLAAMLAALFYAYNWTRERKGDFDIAPADTKGWTLAVKVQTDGQQVVAVKPDGTIVENAGWTAGTVDRDAVWQPDGNRAFFVSDRDAPGNPKGAKAFNIFRWNPVTNGEPDQRTVGTRSRSDPAFPMQPVEGPVTALITSGGFVQEFDAKDRSTRQILPPVGNEVATSNDEGGAAASSQFSAFYGELGNSFRTARWLHGKDFIAAVMRRDEGEVLVIQDMRPTSDGKFKRPLVPAAGERIDLAVDPKSGNLVFSVMGFAFPPGQPVPDQFKKGNTITVPFKNALFRVDPEKGMEPPVAASNVAAFAHPVISPDGSQIVMVVGQFADGAITPKQLSILPNQSGAAPAQATLVEGEVYEPVWSKDGSRILYAKRTSGSRSIFEIGKDGSGERNLTGGKGDFANPAPSPQ
ncbi:hypothetical protein BH11ARM2_BH11ARM2_35560 [soil metagenome]